MIIYGDVVIRSFQIALEVAFRRSLFRIAGTSDVHVGKELCSTEAMTECMKSKSHDFVMRG